MSRISPQGYLLATDSTLYAPMARVSPAAFDRKDGRLLGITYFGKAVGGTFATLAGDEMYTGTEQLVAYRGTGSKDHLATFDGRKIVVTADTDYILTGKQLEAVDRRNYPVASRKVQSLRVKREALDASQAALRVNRNTMSREAQELETDLAHAENPAQRQQLQTKLETIRRKLAVIEATYGKQADDAAKLKKEIKKTEAEAAGIFLWRVPCTCDQALILAGHVLFAGGMGQAVAMDTKSGANLWSTKVEGAAKGLAAAGGRLFVSTDKGLIYCFGPAGSPQAAAVAEAPAVGDVAVSPLFDRAAELILRQTGVRQGYCLVLGSETGELAVALASKSDLRVYAVADDEAKARTSRAAAEAAGLYGGRVCVDQWPLDKVPYSDYFANLVVSETAMTAGELPDAGEMLRMLKPCGGVAFIGRPTRRGARPSRSGLARPLAAAAGPRENRRTRRPVGPHRPWPAARGRKLDPLVRRAGKHGLRRRPAGQVSLGRALVRQSRAGRDAEPARARCGAALPRRAAVLPGRQPHDGLRRLQRPAALAS